MQDFKYAARTLRKSSVFTITAAMTIALGIGASTAIFSVTNAVLLRPLPYKNPDRLVLAWKDYTKPHIRNLPFNNGELFDLRDNTSAVFEDIGAVFTFRVIVPREDGTPERIYKAQVTTNFFQMMGAKIALGRDFTPADGLPQPNQPLPPVGSVAILSYEYWQRRYGGNAAVIGHELISPGRRGPEIVGVLAPGFQLLFPASAITEAKPDVWIANNLGYDRGPAGLRVIGRLRSGMTLKRAQEQVDLAAKGMTPELSIRLQPMLQSLVTEVRPAILALMGAVIFLLLIACSNVANLVLVRASLRERELAVRAALGGGWWRLVRQMLAEAVLLTGLGTLAGVGFAWLSIRGLLVIAPANLPRLESIAIDWRVLAFAAVAGLAAAAIFGVAPAWHAARPDVMQILRGGGRAAGLEAGRVLRNGVVIAEVALSFVLLVGSGLMFRSFLELRRVDLGYDPHSLLTFLLVRDWQSPETREREAFLREIQKRLRALPGVDSVAAGTLPLTGGSSFGMSWATEQTLADAGKPPLADTVHVLPGYFETMRTPLIEGRTFTDDDNAPGRNVAVIDQFLAAKAFPNESAIGKQIVIPMLGGRKVEVIGVVKHQRIASLATPGREQIYFTDAFMLFGVSRQWAIRTQGDPAKLAPAVRAELARFDPQLLMLEIQPMDAIVRRAEAGTRFSLLLIGGFAAVAALLAGVGLYGVLATVVRQRTVEIGVRMALGAAPVSIFNLVVGLGLRLSTIGMAIGLLAALGLTRVMTSMLVGVAATDPTTFAVICVFFFCIAGIASWLPARRAAALDPAVALREE
jgi:putative ABC transport system permease protein